ncbi:MAG: radical SAM protein [Syntrophales bacterium]|nr:radical SAM protein [Syntrophales bacterium]
MISRRSFIIQSIVLGSAMLATLPTPRLSSAGHEKEPAYKKLDRAGILARRIEEAWQILEDCRLCPRMCRVNRLEGERGFCRTLEQAVVYSASPHFGEEFPLVGQRGSGTIFFSNCSLRCVFCQNWPIAHEGRGQEANCEHIASLIINMQRLGCHNVNLVTSTHILPNILKALKIAIDKGLSIPLVYNTSGYEGLELIKLLDGIIDIYMPDFKFMDPEMADTYSPGARDYPERASESIIEMNRQVGVLELDYRNIARRGLLIRHLVMPNRVAGTKEFTAWVAENLPHDTYLNIMPQYRVEHRAFEYPKISRGITRTEFLEAVGWAEERGLTNLDARSLRSRDTFLRSFR